MRRPGPPVRACERPVAGDGGCTSDRAMAKANKLTATRGADCSNAMRSCDRDHSPAAHGPTPGRASTLAPAGRSLPAQGIRSHPTPRP